MRRDFATFLGFPSAAPIGLGVAYDPGATQPVGDLLDTATDGASGPSGASAGERACLSGIYMVLDSMARGRTLPNLG